MPHNLLIVRTAFQGWLARKILSLTPEMSYDLVQISHNNAHEERHQFNYLSKGAQRADFILQAPHRFDFLTHIALWRKLPTYVTRSTYNYIYLASLDAPVIGAIASRQRGAKLITWDDGIANIVPGGAYQSGKIPWRSAALRRALTASTIGDLRNRIEKHFTIFDTEKNIVDSDRLCSISIDIKSSHTEACDNSLIKYFIGQPFHEVMSPSDINWLETEATKRQIDWYVKHPRENKTLSLGAPEIDKSGNIAEEAIMRHASGRPFELIGSFSSTLFTLSKFAERSTMLLPEGMTDRSRLAELGRRIGNEIV